MVRKSGQPIDIFIYIYIHAHGPVQNGIFTVINWRRMSYLNSSSMLLPFPKDRSIQICFAVTGLVGQEEEAHLDRFEVFLEDEQGWLSNAFARLFL